MKILIADDDPTVIHTLRLFCRGQDFDVEFAGSGEDAINLFREGGVDIIVTDLRMPGVTGETVMEEVHRLSPETPVILMTAHGSVDDAVRFLKRGAFDYVQKPVTREVFNHRIKIAIERVAMARELEALKASVEGGRRSRIIGNTPAIHALLRRLPMAAQTDASVVIYGESGTGKELVAERIHELSKRCDERFVVVNCGALSDTLLESELFGYKRGAFTDAHQDTPGLVDEAEGGTLFLDEIGEVSPAVQVKLLRFMQFKEYKSLGSPKLRRADVRIISATNRNLKKETSTGGFREDLYYRLNVVPLTVPPLRDRRSDIPVLAMHFLNKFRAEFGKDVKGFSPHALASMAAHDWPGNVRELENKVQQLVVLATGPIIDSIGLGDEDDPFVAKTTGAYKDEKRRLVDSFEREYVRRMLARTDDNLSEAARLSGLDRKNFWLMAKKHGFRKGRTPRAQAPKARA